MDVGEFVLSEEELLRKHRLERRDLQARIQSLKKTAPKGDKRKKKEVADTILKLEKELDEKQNRELDAVAGDRAVNDLIESAEEENDAEPSNSSEEQTVESAKVSRAQRRRNKKLEEDKEREKRISEQEEANRQGPRVLETNAIKDILKGVSLDIHNIPADGNCLYCAINHQLETTGRETSTTTKLRKMTADYMRQHKDDFLPFMYSDSGEAVDDKEFEGYCKEVASTKLWGGQLELKALSHILKCPIRVIQASGPSTMLGEQYGGTPLVLTYHRHLYRLGEHYNSTTVSQFNDEKDDD